MLAENLKALMVKKYGKENQTRLGEDSELGQTTVRRAINAENARLETIDALANALGVKPHELLMPGLDPDLVKARDALEKAALDFASTKNKP